MSQPNPSRWLEPPSALVLEPGVVHVWRVTDDISRSRLDELALALNPDEHRRAAAFRFDADRTRFMLCRAVLRQLLGRYLGHAPNSIRFAGGARGKPALATSDQGPPIEFNLSHTKGTALFAFALGQPIGVDIEAMDVTRNWEPLAERFLHPNEWQRILNQPATQRAAAFYAYWTWKEAYVKAIGEGLSRGLTTFEVIPKTEPAGWATLREPTDANAARWWLQSLDPGPNFAAAVASPAEPVELHWFQWDAGE